MKICIRKFDRRSIGLLLLAVSLQPLAAGKTTTLNVPAQSSSAASSIDYVNAKPLDLPIPFRIMDTKERARNNLIKFMPRQPRHEWYVSSKLLNLFHARS